MLELWSFPQFVDNSVNFEIYISTEYFKKIFIDMCCSLCRLLLKQLQALLFMNVVALIKLFYVSLSAKTLK